MNPEEGQPPIPESCAQSEPHSPKTLASQALGLSDGGPQKPQIFLDFTEIDDDADPPLPTSKSPSAQASPAVARRGARGKKTGAKWRGKKNQEKIDALLRTFKPVPFSPAKALDFGRHEDLLKRLGLWEFVNLSFDTALRSDLIVQLVTAFKKKDRGSYVNGVKVGVNRADLARALKLPIKKKERASSGLEISVEKPENAESIGFLAEFVSNWVLLHDEMLILPGNVMSWYESIREGRFESLDWADMMWFMVEKEISQGLALKNCYYASHLQCLIRSQREELLREEVDGKDDDDEDVKMVDLEDRSLELSLGHENVDSADVDEKEGAASAEASVGKEESSGGEKRDEEDESGAGQEEDRLRIHEEGNGEAGVGEEEAEDAEEENVAKQQGGVAEVTNSDHKVGVHGESWFLDAENDAGEPFLQRCSYNTVGDIDMGYSMDKKADEEEEEEEGEEGQEMEEQEEDEGQDDDDDDEEQEDERGAFHMSDNLMNGLSSANLIQAMDNSQMPFSSGVSLRDDSCGEFLASSSRAETHLGHGGLSVYGNPNKREMDHDNELLLNNGPNKRMRMEPLDFNTCSENAQRWLEKMRVAHEEREQMWAASTMNQEVLLDELQQRNMVIEHLHKERAEDQQKAHQEIYRLERELGMMVGLVEGYRKALKESNKAFADYRARCPQLDEPFYKDVPGSGGLVLSVTELEKQRLRREEEERRTILNIKDGIKDFEAVWRTKFETHLEKAADRLADRLLNAVEEMKALKELAAERNAGQEKAEEPTDEEKAEEPADEKKPEERADEKKLDEPADEMQAEEPTDENNLEEPTDERKAEERADDEMAEESTGQETAGASAGQETAQAETEG